LQHNNTGDAQTTARASIKKLKRKNGLTKEEQEVSENQTLCSEAMGTKVEEEQGQKAKQKQKQKSKNKIKNKKEKNRNKNKKIKQIEKEREREVEVVRVKDKV